jgi:hypothetical protein
VARYGGEEFVMLCADCDNAGATRRAEQARKALSQIRHARLDGGSVTASFGVTEVQPGDTPETMLRRADRALLAAKDQGRNMVVQLGVGTQEAQSKPSPASDPRASADATFLVEQRLITSVPLWVAVEKLRGFIADHRAKVLKVDANCVELLVDVDSPKRLRRFSDRPTTFHVKIKLDEQPVAKPAKSPNNEAAWVQTRLYVTITLEKGRERRREEVAHRAKELLVSFRSYLMASEEEASHIAAACAEPGDEP